MPPWDRRWAPGTNGSIMELYGYRYNAGTARVGTARVLCTIPGAVAVAGGGTAQY